MPARSGASWVGQFPGSVAVDDLEPTFRAHVKSFIDAMRAGGALVTVSSTFRPPERAYLMHWSWKIVNGGADPEHVPSMPGVDIIWWHGDAAASKRGAQEMVDGFGTGGSDVAPSLVSRHTERRAIDMSISWTGPLSIKKGDGTSTMITSTPRDGTNTQLIAVGASYHVMHFIRVAADRPHWSNDGH